MDINSLSLSNNEPDIDVLVKLIIDRLHLAPKVAAAKWVINKPIDDPHREKLILAGLAAKASEAGVDTKWAIEFFNDQFLASKMIQFDSFHKWRLQNEVLGQASENIQVIDLAKDVRPYVDAIDDKLFEWFRINLKNCDFDEAKLQKAAENFNELDEIYLQAFQRSTLQLITLCSHRIKV